MYLARVHILNFRRLKDLTVEFVPGLNVIVGENNMGKSAVVDAIRSLVPDPGETFLRLSEDDVHQPEEGDPTGNICFELEFAGLSLEEEADLLDALVEEPDKSGFRARFSIEYTQRTGSDHWLKVTRTCGELGISVSSQLLENLRMVYLPRFETPLVP